MIFGLIGFLVSISKELYFVFKMLGPVVSDISEKKKVKTI